jgi:hypothetical protein
MRRRAWGVIVGLALVLVVGGAIVLGVMAVAAWRDRAAERERITREYREIAEAGRGAKYAPYDIPGEGFKRCLEAIRSAGRSDWLFVSVAPEYEILLLRADEGEDRGLWHVSPNVLRVARPVIDVSEGLNEQEAALLHHYYASAWIKDHAKARVAVNLLWVGSFARHADGTWSVESGMSLISGDGLRSHIAADGSLIDMNPVFSPD